MATTPADLPAGWMRPAFTSPRVVALMTGRHGGVSAAPFDSFNLRPGLGDDDAAVSHNRALLRRHLGLPVLLLRQVHGASCLALDGVDRRLFDGDPDLARAPAVDAACSTRAGVACEIQVADCLPVLLADRQGRGVAAAHAGWRGLAGGVVEAALQALCAATGARPDEIEVWLGPCIGPRAFEVGEDVRSAFSAAPAACFVPCAPAGDVAVDSAGHAPGDAAAVATPRVDASSVGTPGANGSQGSPKWWADLPALARWRLAQAGVSDVNGNDGSPAWCTVENPAYFSYRRERGRTGRQAAFIGLRDRA